MQTKNDISLANTLLKISKYCVCQYQHFVKRSLNIVFVRYQVLVGVLFAFLELPHAWCMLLHKFLSPTVDYWCSQPSELSHWSTDQWRNFSSPPGDSCNLYNR